MSFLFFAWFASISYGFVTIIGKLTSKYSIPNPWLFGFLYSLFVFLFTSIPAFGSVGLHILPSSWPFIILAGLAYGLTTLFFTLSLFMLDASVVSSLFNFRSVFAAILASIILKESLGNWQILLIAVIFIAGLFSTIDERLKIKTFFHFTTLIGLLTTFFIALQSVFTNLSLQGNNYWTVSLWMPGISTIFLLVTLPLFWKDIRKIHLNQIGAVALMSALSAFATLTANKAFASNVNISSVILSLPISLVIAICLSVFYPKLLEKHTAKVYAIRVVAAIVMIIAALKLS